MRVLSNTILDENGCSETGRNLAGRWRQTSQNAVYSVGFHMEPMKILAGFLKDQPYPIVNRDLIIPPKELLDMVFPWVEAEKAHIDRNIQSGFYQTEIAAFDHIKVMQYLAKVLLQDAVCKMEMVGGFSCLQLTSINILLISFHSLPRTNTKTMRSIRTTCSTLIFSKHLQRI
jgi:hypothetical protein